MRMTRHIPFRSVAGLPGAALLRSELGHTLRLAGPLVLTQLAWVGMMAVDTAMIGRLGAEPLAGATLSLMAFFLVYVACFGVMIATASLASQAFGARRPRLVRRVVRQGLWASLILTLPWLVLFEWMGAFLALIGQPAATLPHAEAYIATLKWSLPFSIAFAVLRNFCSALNRPMVAMWVMLVGLPLNALLDYALIFGHFGFPRLELTGAGLTTTLVNAAMFLTLLAIAVIRKPFARYQILLRFWRPDWELFRRIFRIGTPIAGSQLLEAGFFISVAFVMGQFGVTAIAANMIALQWPHIAFMVPLGIGQAATVRVGHAVGRRDVEAAYRAGWMAWRIALVFMACMSVIVLLIPEAFASLFLDTDRADSEAVLSLAVTFLFYAALFQVVDGLQAVANGALRGLNDTTMPMVFAAISYWGVGLAVGAGLAFGTGLDGEGLWIGFVAGLSTSALLLTARFRRLQRRGFIPALTRESAASDRL